MRYLKALGLAAIAAGALMAFVGASTAAATELDCSATAMCPAVTEIHAEASGPVTLHPIIGDIECKESTVKGHTTNTGSSTETVDGPIETLTFGTCNTEEVKVLNAGELIVHTDTAGVHDGNGTLTSKGAEVTVKFHGFHCIFGSGGQEIDVGTIDGSKTTGKTATLTIKATFPRLPGSLSGAFCGSQAEWTGDYTITSPDYLDVT